ncbi:MAG: phytase, partial [Planctomycetota bacterium]
MTGKKIITFTVLGALLAGAWYVSYRRIAWAVPAVAETGVEPHSGDAADDPCIWVNPQALETSLLICTDKKGGLSVFGLDGRELQYLPSGKLNNVDVRNGFPFPEGIQPIVAATNKTDDRIDLFRIDPASNQVVPAGHVEVPKELPPDGICLYRSAWTEDLYAFVTTKKGELVQFRVDLAGGTLIRRLPIGSESEGCVADDDLGFVYVSEENVGIWKYGAEPESGDDRTLVDSTGLFGRLHHDAEGLAIVDAGDGTGYLVVSSQGSDDFLVYRREGSNACVGRFRVVSNGNVDGVDHTDGIDGVGIPLGPRFPAGLLVVQDDDN